MCDVFFERILFYYTEWQSTYSKLNGKIEFREGLPNVDDYSNDNHRKKLIILDDLMRESSSNESILDLFTKGSHHKNISVILITQNLFHQGKVQRSISLNTKYFVIFKNPRDKAQINHFSRQVCPENSKFLQEAYLDATKIPHSYLLVDLTQTTLDEFRFRACIFPDDEVNYIYVPKNIKINS